ncbi:MAG: peptidoglycan-binding protein [Acidimicrobiales bacterium]
MILRFLTTPTRRPRTRRVAVVRRTIVAVTLSGMVVASSTPLGATAAGVHAPGTASSIIGLRTGSEGPGVVAVQERLLSFGYVISGGANGVFGASTEKVVRVFQQQNGLNPTGVITENTARYLGLTDSAVAAAASPASTSASATPAASIASSGSTLRRGNTGESVRRLQTALMAQGLTLQGGADGVFGPATQRAVTLVQRVNGWTETGIADANVLGALGLSGSSPSTAAPASTPSTGSLSYGSRGSAVQKLQQQLMAAGITVRGGADGIYGVQTQDAVRRYQQAKGLSATGTADAATQAALAGRGASSAPAAPATTGYVGLAVGSRGPRVTELQKALQATGLVVRGGADGIFGPNTRSSLVVFQRVNGLAQTGTVDATSARILGLGTRAATFGAGVAAPSTSASSGFAAYDERGPRVVALQTALMRAGITVPGGADGVFGSGTAGAVMKFQRAKGLAVTGRVDNTTAAALGLTAGSAPTPAPAVTVTLDARPVGGPCWYGNTWQAARGSGRVHLGVDIGAREGTPLQAVATGTITYMYADRPGSLSGNALKITRADGTYFFYAHMAGFAPGMAVGTRVTAGQVIGYVGSTGNSAIAHLHFEVHPGGGSAVNPYPIVKASGAC